MRIYAAVFLTGCLVMGLGWAPVLAQQKPPATPEAIGVYDTNFKYMEGRDPFENLTQQRKTKQGKRVINTVGDLLVEEVQIVGIYSIGKKYYVIVRGAGLDRGYTVTIGQKFYNGEILDITKKPDKEGHMLNCVLFKQQTDDPIKPFIKVEKCVAAT